MLIELQDLGKSFGEHEVLCGVSARVERGDRIGIIGANGTGKTTLLRILCGESQPDAGTAAFASNLTVGYLEQAGRLEPDKDVYETMRLAFAPALAALAEQETLQKRLATATETERPGIEAAIAHDMAVIDAMDAYNMDTQIKKVLSGMGFPADTWQKKAGVLSGGEQTRLRLARLLLERPDILILDEPTNHLDLETMEWLETYLKTYRGAVLVVSHDRYFLDAVCTRIWELAGKTILTYKGNYSAYLPQREAADERQQKLHDAAVEKAAKLQDYIDRNLVRASTTKMAQSRRKQLEKLEIVDAPERQGRELSFRFEYDIEPYDELVILKGLSIRIGTRTLLEPLDYTVHRGDKLVIAGPNGAGKSTLLQVLDGKRRPSGGMVRLGTGAKPGIFTQQQARRTGRVIDAIWNQYPRFTELDVRSHLARFGYRGEEVFKDCATLSGGELARLRFAELALERPNLLFLDEPTNHLDIYMRESLTQALAAYTGTLLLVTHDRYLMQTLGCPILYLEDGKATFYRDFEALRQKDTAPAAKPAAAPAAERRGGYGKEQRRRKAELRSAIKALETEIEDLGATIMALEQDINDPDVLRDHLLLRDKCDALDDARFRQQECFDEWEKKSGELEAIEAEEAAV
ncbi:MAG TPA: ABC-F family ATP-binding cassette domain-containing protein [Candidatus Gemmiger avicola]|uniref:ABC-F family ATP-binding cassette domain-containing protein n=1 Tax=Candidatus Gemmiger avicola TaxID=2838605 RepID=A0A9D2S2F9_9FIRM|nr:ABC-F family ATP-binding cassette domain-containing protein [Candidatus Gemmiger avicola]